MGDSIPKNTANNEDAADSESGEDDNYYHLGGRIYDTRDRTHFVNFLNTIVSGTACLNLLLPTATILALTNFTPIITNDGNCNTLDRWILGYFLTLASFYCIFFSLTDSYRTSKGRFYYGIATFSGILTLNGAERKPHSPSEYRLRWADLFHATLSVVALLTFAASQKDVAECYYPQLPRKISSIVPVLVESVVGTLIVLFPSRRKGIGYPFVLQKDSLKGSIN